MRLCGPRRAVRKKLTHTTLPEIIRHGESAADGKSYLAASMESMWTLLADSSIVAFTVTWSP